MLLLNNDDVKSILGMRETMSALRIGYDDLKLGEATYGPRIDHYLPTGRGDDYYRWGNMVGASASLGVVAVRIKSQVMTWPDGGRTQDNWSVTPGLFCGFIILFSSSNGVPLALIQDGYLQHMRVGGSMGIGVELLATKDATTVGLLGSGGMAHTFLESFVMARPIKKVRVFSPTREHRVEFANEMSGRLGIDVVAVESAEEAVREALIVATVTDSMVPTFDPRWIRKGAHVVCVTRRELGEPQQSRRDCPARHKHDSVWHSRAHARVEGGRHFSLCRWQARGPREDSRRQRIIRGGAPTMLDVEIGRAKGRTSDDQVTLFVGTGTQGLQFASVGGWVFHEAKRKGLGRDLPDDWFLQDIRD